MSVLSRASENYRATGCHARAWPFYTRPSHGVGFVAISTGRLDYVTTLVHSNLFSIIAAQWAELLELKVAL